MVQVKSLETGIKFKDTPIGKIPVDWEAGPFSLIADINPKRTLSKGVEYPFVEMAAISPSSSKVQYNSIRKYEGNGSRFKNKDTIFARITPCTENGKTAYVDFLKEGEYSHGSTEFIILGPKENVDSKFVYYCAKWDKVRNLAISKMEGTSGRQRVPNKAFSEDIYIIIPPYNEQAKIADILTTVDNTIEETGTIIEKTKELKKGLMQKLLTHGIRHKKFKKTEIGEIPEEWKVVTLKDVASPERYSFVDGPFGSNLKTIHYKTLGVPVIQSQMVISGTFTPLNKFYVSAEKAKELERSKVKAGDIVIAKIGVNFGASATVPVEYPDAVLSGNTMKITPDKSKIVTQYLQYLLHFYREKNFFDKIVSTTAQPAITLAGVRNLLIPLPDKKEQKEITDALTSLDLELDNEQVCSQQLSILKKSLMQVLLTGRVRVKLH